MKSILKLALILVVGILIYNYFLGTDEEKQQSKEIFTEVRDLGKAAWGLLKSEKEKFDEGKYDVEVIWHWDGSHWHVNLEGQHEVV